MVRVLSVIVFLFIIPLWMVHLGYIFLNNKGGMIDAVSEFTDLRIRNVSVSVVNQGKPVPFAEWHIDADYIRKNMSFVTGKYILSTDPEVIRKIMTNVPWVKKARVKLQLPDKVMITVEENIPYALWQTGGNFYLIDEQGNIITDKNLERYDYLPWIVGENANHNVRDYVMMMNDFADIFSSVKAAYRVGSRRWTLLLHNDVEVSLSEQNPRASLEKLAKLQKSDHILDKKISAIDLRIPTKTFIRKQDDNAMRFYKDGQET